MAIIRTVQELFDALGGANRTAQRLGVSESCVRMWKTRGGIPPHRLFAVRAAARKRGFDVSDSLWLVPSREAAE